MNDCEEADEAAAAAQLPAVDTDHTDCIICFEALESRGGAIPLPCECRVPYCADCWDRSLAASISSCGRALCPSCRGAMRVDFNASVGHLSFSRAPACESGEDPLADDWRRRLYEQAKPKQIQLLQEFGAQHPTPSQSSSGISPGGYGAGVGNDRPAGEATGAALAVDVTPEPARCVCGCALAEVSVRDRVLTFVQEEAPITPPRSLVRRLMLNPPIVCDICCRRVQPSSKVWTCENGRRTVLHAAAYDVCESCFIFHAYGVDEADCPEGSASDVDNDFVHGHDILSSDPESEEEDCIDVWGY